jgi:hypothetical protein
VQCLLDNVEKFTEILTILAAEHEAEEWMKAALQAWLCRHPKAPISAPSADPKRTPSRPPTPPPDQKHPTDPGSGSLLERIGEDVTQVAAPLVIAGAAGAAGEAAATVGLGTIASAAAEILPFAFL